MTTFKFIHTADIHLDSPLRRLEYYEGAPAAEVRGASRRAFENLIALALGESVDFILIAGDLFDGDWMDYNSGLYFISQVQRLKTAGIHVFIVSGNHDAAGRMTRVLPYPDNVHLFPHHSPQTRTLEPLKVAVHGQSFASPAVMENLARRYPELLPGYFNIGLLHTSLTGREGHENYAPCTLQDLENRGYDYWALGHVHRFERVSETPLVIFPGCLQGRNARETGVKGSVLVSVEGGRIAQAVACPHDVIRWTRLTVALDHTVNRQAGLEAFQKELESLVAQNDPLPVIVRVRFTGATEAHADISGDLEYWKEAVRSTALAIWGERVWIQKISVQTRPLKRAGQVFIDPGPLRELDRLVASLVLNDAETLALTAAIEPLLNKLPAEYRQGENALQPENPEQWRQIIRQAHDLLVKGLRKEPPSA
jgi:DNA repair exonuclease SbcCD nuclease subunit